MKPPFDTFKRPTCRGSYVLGSACGSCEKCKWERDQQHVEREKEVEKILAMSDEEIMIDAIREYGSPEAASKAADRIRDGIMNTIKLWRLDRFMKGDDDAAK